MFCNRCGHDNDSERAFCSVCEHPLEDIGAPTQMDPAVIITSDANLTDDGPDYGDAPNGALLMVRNGSQRGERYEITEVSTRLGRDPDNDIALDDITVSRRHAVIESSGLQYVVHDLRSMNGTYVNHERIEQSTLAHGDEIRVGRFRLVFTDRASQAESQRERAGAPGSGSEPAELRGTGANHLRSDLARCILVIDDQPSILDVLCTALRYEGLNVIAGRTGKEALELWDIHHPDLLLLDVMLPDIDGVTVARWIRTAGIEPPMILIMASDEESIPHLDNTQYVSKPFRLADVVGRVHLALAR